MSNIDHPFIVTKAGYWFETKIQLDHQVLLDAGCVVFETQAKMYEFICLAYGYDIDEVEGADMIILDSETMVDSMGHHMQIECSPENFIIEFEM